MKLAAGLLFCGFDVARVHCSVLPVDLYAYMRLDTSVITALSLFPTSGGKGASLRVCISAAIRHCNFFGCCCC